MIIKQKALDEGYRKHPERWVHGPPKVKRPSIEVLINAPTKAMNGSESEAPVLPEN
jgi:hypothetical protein